MPETEPGTSQSRTRRRVTIAVVLMSLALVLPIPWLLPRESSWGMSWRLDGRLTINGETIDPDGEWSWLTAGRPPVLAEVLMTRRNQPVRDLRQAPAAIRPNVNEPMAAAVGLAHAGWDISFDLIVEATGPQGPDYPELAVVVEMNGVPLVNLEAWWEAVTNVADQVTFRTEDGTLYHAPGPGLPYDRVYIVDEAPPEIDAVVGGRLAEIPPLSWFRGMGVGGSHGLIVALVTYAHAVDPGIAADLHVAGTGGIRSDGTITRIGGLPAKAAAAKRAGVDLLFFPAAQTLDLLDFDPGVMDLVPVYDLAEAIAYLEERR